MLKRFLRKVAVVMVVAAISAPIALNSENMTVSGGYDHVFGTIWHGVAIFADRVVDPHLGWLFWIAIGSVIGSVVSSWIRRFEETSRGKLGGPSLRYLRWEARFIRWAIAWPWLRGISSDFEQDLNDLDQILSSVHGFPSFPTTTFTDPIALEQTSEYLRLILPNLDRHHMNAARDAANIYKVRVATLPNRIVAQMSFTDLSSS